MNENSVVSLRQKDEIDDPLTEILRAGARKLIVQAGLMTRNDRAFTLCSASHAHYDERFAPSGMQWRNRGAMAKRRGKSVN